MGERKRDTDAKEKRQLVASHMCSELWCTARHSNHCATWPGQSYSFIFLKIRWRKTTQLNNIHSGTMMYSANLQISCALWLLLWLNETLSNGLLFTCATALACMKLLKNPIVLRLACILYHWTVTDAKKQVHGAF